MKAGLIGLVIVVVLLLGLGGCVAGNYNKLVAGKNDVANKWAQVDNQLQRRNDLIGNLVESVKGAAGQEQAVFGEIANARAQMAGAKSPQQSIAAAQTMDGAIGRLLVVVENYPQLKSEDAFRQLMDELAGTENRLATERMRYNDTVRDYDVLVQSFPTNLFAGAFHFEAAAMYPVPEAAKAVPKVDFSGLRTPAAGTPAPAASTPPGK
ncbi:MAG TPA: LemA family protein [Candidatus Acidoferrales bacterium]|nr:LemA family protein [Candidatus Acidoferrales bacterium]